MKKKILICGGGGFIGHHLAKRLHAEGHKVVVVDLKMQNEYADKDDYCSAYLPGDLTTEWVWDQLNDIYHGFDEIYQLAADMGGAGYIFTGDNDLNVMTNSAMINLHAVKWAIKWKAKVFYSSSACMYPAYNQEDPDNPKCSEDSAYPAAPDSEYGWEKLFSERLYLTANRNAGLDVRIARFHNIFGPEGTWDGGKEKAPAALCRKVAKALDGDEIEIWGPGTQTRSFLYIDECIEAILRLMDSDFLGPVNIGSEEMIAINDLAQMIIRISGKNLCVVNVSGPIGVMGRNSDNKLIRQKLHWEPTMKLEDGIKLTYSWINNQITRK
jgi:nucleoside-diphosphate-sugar epimerase